MGFRAVVLAGGRGTRLAPFTRVLPKPLLPVGERPILDLLLGKLAREGCERVTLSVGYLGHLIEAYCGRGERWGITVDYVREEEPLGTVGALALMEDPPEEPFLVLNGDILTDFSFPSIFDVHEASGACLTIAAYRRRVREELGVLEVDRDGVLVGYHEKPEREYLVSMGVYCMSAECIGFIRVGERLDFPDLVGRLLAAGRRIQTMIHDGDWLDLGRYDDFFRANEEWPDQEGFGFRSTGMRIAGDQAST